MPLTFIDIERQKNWRIALFFLVLLFLYFCVTALFAGAFLHAPFSAFPRLWVFIAVLAALTAGFHFWFSASDTLSQVKRELSAAEPDSQDEVHRVLINIMKELHVVTGHRRSIGCFVIPSLSLNALAVADLRGNAAIGITEGLLSRLTRPQLETVVAHEAHHILSGDCLETTVAASIFGTYATALERLSDSSRGRSFGSPAFLLAWALLQLSYLLNLFISREREYRADAASVRMTRDPLALAETLHLLSRSWRGAGFIGSGFEMLCIVNPKAMALDESEGWWADLLSTHPPLRRRIQLLLDMTRVSVTELESRTNRRTAVRGEVPGLYAMDPQRRWQGPFSSAELGTLSWLSPLTWVTAGEGSPVGRAWKEQTLDPIFARRLAQQNEVSSHSCPSCSQPLAVRTYEAVRIFQCQFCAGALVEDPKIPRIIARTGRETGCSARVTALARAVTSRNQARLALRGAARPASGIPLLACPGCANPMRRGFYSSAHLIEVDRCGSCGVTWFDQDELAMLQCLIENRIVPGIEMQDSPVARLA